MRIAAAVLILGACGGLAVCARDQAEPRDAAAMPRDRARDASDQVSLREDLAVFDAPDRDEWQQPDKVMDVLGVAEASKVADLGAAGGWFTSRLSRRVGPNGLVYADDPAPEMVAVLDRRVASEGLTNVRTRTGTPHLPSGLHAVIVDNAWARFADPEGLLQRVAEALAPGGRLGVIDFTRNGEGGPGPPPNQRPTPGAVTDAARRAGLTLRTSETFLRYQFFLVFVK